MAEVNFQVAQTIREASRRIQASNDYQWGHMGSCNCGFLAQVVTKYSKEEIHQTAMQGCGDWSEQLNDYCPTSGLPMDELISALLSAGFYRQDLHHLERLSDPEIVQKLSPDQKALRQNSKPDVVRYLNAWASLIEDQLVSTISSTKSMHEWTLPQFKVLSLNK